jgi:hypothetical protein
MFFFSSVRGLFYPFPLFSGSLSVFCVYFGLGDGPPSFPWNSTCSTVLGVVIRKTYPFHLQDYHLLWSNFPEEFD